MTYSAEVLADSPLIYWRLGETSGTTATDSSGNGKHGTYTGTLTLGTTGLLTGDADLSLTVPTSNGQVTVADTTDLTAFTAECWIKTSDTGAPLVTRRGSSSSDDIFKLGISGGNLQGTVWKNSGSSAVVTGAAVANNATHHVVLTYDGTTVRLYLDGASTGTPSTAISGALPTVNTAFVAAGEHTFNGYGGVIDEVAYYATALSAARILAHCNEGTGNGANEAILNGTVPAVVGAVNLDTGSTVHLAGIVGPVVGAIELDNFALAQLELVGVVPSVVASAHLVHVVTPERNRAGAWTRDNIGEAIWTPAVVEPTEILPENRVVAFSYATPTIDGTHLILDTTELAEPAHRDRIIVGGIDITYFRGVATPPMDFQYVQPLGWAAGSFRFPQAVVPFETPGLGALSFLAKDAPVIVQRIDTSDNTVVRTDYRGFVLAHSISGGELVIETAGHGVGRAALQDRQMMLIQQRFDAGAHVRRALEAMRVRCSPPRGAVTGINLIRWGGGGLLDYFNELVAKMTTTSGDQWTVMPTDDGTYVTALKDLTTIHGTIYLDRSRIKGDLRSDASEEPNRIFASGVTPEGMVVKFGAYPGLIQAAAAPYPMTDGSSFGIGTVDADTDTGDGVTVMIWQLRSRGFVDVYQSLAAYDAEVAEGIKDLQRRAGLSVTGTMTTNTWKALFNLSVTGYNLSNIRILPAAEDPRVQPWRLSSNGSIIARNPAYVPAVIPKDRSIAMGAGFTRRQIQQWARNELVTTTQWRGTIEINTGAIVAGDHTPGDPVTALLRGRDIRPGMNLQVWPLDIVVHVAGVSVAGDAAAAEGKVTLAVDTRPGDTMPVWAAIQRDRDNRNTVHRSFNAQRKSSTFDRENTIDEVGGLTGPIELDPNNWTVFPVVAKQAGTIEKIHLDVSPNREYVVVVTGRKIGAGRLRRVTNAPLTLAGRKRWTEEAVYDALNRDHVVMYVAGSDEDPLGYFPGRKSEDDSLTGRWEDDASFPFVTYMNNTDRGSVLWVAVWVGASATLTGGRIMWPSAEEY